MSELSICELEAEHGDLLPERETLGVIIATNVGSANASEAFAVFTANQAVLVQKNVIIGNIVF